MSEIEVVLQPHAAVAEGPVWDERTSTLVWVDIMANAVHVFDPASGDDRAIDLGQPVGAAALRERGGLVLALRDGFAVMDADLGDLRWVARVEDDITTNRMNDGKCDAAGRFWAGTMPFGNAPGVGSLYRLDPDYRMTRMLTDVSLSNGLGWTADNRRMYYVDSPTQQVDVFDFDVEQGLISNRTTLIRVPREDGMPDGMTVDVDGGIWVALHGGGVVHRYTPDGQLDITSMTYQLPVESLGDPALAGSLFRARPGVRGRPSYRFAG
jgi:sugar lactone lactonase YvrE